MINENNIMDAELREESHEHPVIRGTDVPPCIQNEARNNASRGTEDAIKSDIADPTVNNGDGSNMALNLSVLARDIEVKKLCGYKGNTSTRQSTESSDEAAGLDKEQLLIHTERGKEFQSSSGEVKNDSIETPTQNEFGKCSFSDLSKQTINSPKNGVSEPDQIPAVTFSATSNQPVSTEKKETSSAASLFSISRETPCASNAKSVLLHSPQLVCTSQVLPNEPSFSEGIKNVSVDSTFLVPLASCATDVVTSQPQLFQSTSFSSKTMDTSESVCSSIQQNHSSLLPVSKCADTDNQHSITTSCTISSPTAPPSLVSTSTSKFSTSTNNVHKDVTTAVSMPGICLQSNIKVEGSEHKGSDSEAVESDSQEELYSPSSSGLKNTDSPCKILTKYIFINKPDKVRRSRKRLGVLYKQAFRHFQKSKFNSLSPKRKHLTVIEKKRHRNQSEEELEGEGEPKVKKKRGGNDSIKKTAQRKGLKNGKAKVASVKKTLPVKSEETTNCRKSPRKVGQRGSLQDDDPGPSCQRKQKGRTRKSLSLKEKADIINQFENPSVSFSSIAKRYNVGKSSLARIVKQKDTILAQLQDKGKRTKKVKKCDKGKKAKIIKEPVIKIERCDDEVNEDEIDFKAGSVVRNNSFSEDTISSRPGDNSSAGKIRRELTLGEKVWMIQELDTPGIKIKNIAKKFGVSTSAVSRVRKFKDRILSRSLSGDVCHQMRRSRDCKDPVLDKALLKWYRAVEALKDQPISISNSLLQDKSKDIALAMGRSYFPTANWIIRWKYRHNILCKSGRIESKDILDELDANVDLADIIMAFEGQSDGTVRTENEIKLERSEKLIVCEHCGIMINRRKDRRKSNHLKTCPLSSQSKRRELTLGEKAQVVRALEKPGMKMVTLAKKYGVSSSAISRIHKNRVDILARCAATYVNVGRKRDRGCKEPEVERSLCDWYHQQQEYGYHVSGSAIREKAHEIAVHMGKEFWPSESWVFRWRHRHNFSSISGLEELDEEREIEEINEVEMNNTEAAETEGEDKATSALAGEENQQKDKKTKKKDKTDDTAGEEKVIKPKLPRSVMCEKCGCVSSRLKNNRIRNMRHAKGCPDLKPRNELTYEERMKMLKALEEPGATLSSVARQYGISASSMSRMNQKKDRIMTRGMDFAGHKRIRDCKEPEVAKLLYDWFMGKQQEGIHVTGTKLKEKAGLLAREMGREFKASTGWLGRWKHRYNAIIRQKDEVKTRHDLIKKKTSKKKESPSLKQDEVMESTEENHQDSVSTNVITILPQEVQPLQAPRMFLNHHYQTPWNQPSTSSSRPKDFIPAPNHGVPEESHVPYAYDHMSRQMFHNMFENFATAATASYPMSMVEPSVPVRDYLQPDENESHMAGSSHHPIIHHQAPPLNLHSSGLTTQQNPVRPHQHPLQHSSHSPITSVQDGENVQQQQIMEACKLMNSFAKEKALGEHIQAAIRTIEMSIKGGERKGPPRTTYTNI